MSTSLSLGPAVETYICWLIDNRPEALQVCNIGDLAIMYAEECGTEASAPFVQNFYEACLKFLRRLEKSTEPMKFSKIPNNLHVNVPADARKQFHTLETSQNHAYDPQADYNNQSGRRRRLSAHITADPQPTSRIELRPSDTILFSMANSTTAYAPRSLEQPNTTQSPSPILVNETPTPAPKVEPILSRFFSFQPRPS